MSYRKKSKPKGLKWEIGKYLVYGGSVFDFSAEPNYSPVEFDKLIELLKREIDLYSGWDDSKEKKLFAIDAILTILRQDLMYSCMSDGIYNNNEALSLVLNIPTRYKNMRGEEIDIKSKLYWDGKTIKLDLTQTCTLTKPRSTNKYITNVYDRNEEGKGFIYKKGEHKVDYYPTLEMAIVEKGFHSIADGILNRGQVLVTARVVDDKSLLESVCTDGRYWYNRYDRSYAGKPKSGYTNEPREISNFISLKFAILFALVQYRQEIEREE